MANIRIKDLPADGAPKQTDLIPIDLGSTRHATVKSVVESGRPTASKTEAELGVEASKAMTPLTTKQAIDAQVGASYVPKTVKINAGSGMTGGGELSGDVTVGLTVENVDRLTKVDGIEAGATKNQTDAHLLARANHTGTQAISTVSGLQGALDGKLSTDGIAADSAKLGGETAQEWSDKINVGGIYDTKAAAEAANIPSSVNAIRLNGGAALGDGNGGLYIDTDNGSTDMFISSDGRTWYRVKDVGEDRLTDSLMSKLKDQESFIYIQDFNPLAGSSFTVGVRSAFQAAIDKSSSTGKPIYIPNGEYGLEAFVIMKPGVHITLDGRAVIKRTAHGEMIRNWEVGGIYVGRTAHGNWSITGGTIDGAGATLPSNASMATLFKAENVHFQSVKIKNITAGHPFDLMGMKNISFIDCDFEDSAGEVVQLERAWANGFGFNTGIDPSSFDNMMCDGVKVVGCRAVRTGIVVGSHGASAWIGGYPNNWHENIIIDDLVVEDCTSDAVCTERWRGFSISNVRGYGGASDSGRCFIRLINSGKFKVSNCHGIGPYPYRGIFVDSAVEPQYSDWVVEDCSVDGVTTGSGFEAYRSRDGAFVRCNPKNVNGVGVYFNACEQVAAIDCVTRNTNTIGISINASTACYARGGVVSGGYTNAAVIYSSSDSYLDGLTITDLVTGRTGPRTSVNSVRPIIRNCRIIGTGGVGIEVAATVTTAWLDGNDLRGMSGGTKISGGANPTVSTNNQT